MDGEIAIGPVAPVAHGPNVVRGNACHSSEYVTGVMEIGGGHDGPCHAVVVHDEAYRGTAYAGHACIAHSPDIVQGDGGDSIQLGERLIGVGAGYYAPARAVPVLDEGF